jgi:coenzyme PQQ precursor peptide PqqA
MRGAQPYVLPRAMSRSKTWLKKLGETRMAWKAPKIVEVPVGMEINMYACAARK